MKAVLEFFTAAPVAPDPALLEVMAQIGRHLGRVVERIRAQEQIAHQATHDALTGLANRAPLPRSSRACAGARRAPRLVRRAPVPGSRQVQGRQRHARAQRRGPAPEVRLGPAAGRPCERATHWRASATRCSRWRASAATSSSCSARTSLRRTARCGSRSESSEALRRPFVLERKEHVVTASIGIVLASGTDRDAEACCATRTSRCTGRRSAARGTGRSSTRRFARARSSASRRSGHSATRWKPESCGSTTSRS